MQETTTEPALWQTFAAQAAPLGAAVEIVPDQTAAVALLAERAGAPVATSALAVWFPGVAGHCPAPADAAPATAVVAPGAFAIAETGSVAVCATAADRAACFLAEHLWLVVRASAIVPTLDVALARVAALVRAGAPHVTFMSGPSRTADIERTLTIGVHGPRALTVVVVGAE